jgi:hypothetical protein
LHTNYLCFHATSQILHITYLCFHVCNICDVTRKHK